MIQRAASVLLALAACGVSAHAEPRIDDHWVGPSEIPRSRLDRWLGCLPCEGGCPLPLPMRPPPPEPPELHLRITTGDREVQRALAVADRALAACLGAGPAIDVELAIVAGRAQRIAVAGPPAACITAVVQPLALPRRAGLVVARATLAVTPARLEEP